MNMADRLAEERRARLAAERLLELKQSELFAANRKLGQRAMQLTHEISETRAEVAEVRDENRRVVMQLGEATEKIELVEDQLWTALETIQDGFAMFTPEDRLELANPAYMAVFEGVDDIHPGCSFGQILDVMTSEGIVDLQGESAENWKLRMLQRWREDPIPPVTLRLWNGQFVKIQDRRTPDGGLVSLCVNITELMRMWSAVEELPDGFVIYDGEDRLLMCNQPYRDIYAKSAAAMTPGTPFEDILRHGIANGQYPDAIGQEEAWLEERLLRHRHAGTELEQKLDDGRWIRVYERETSDGGRVGLRIDITDIKRDQERLKEAMVRAEAANRAKSAFLANMSHEIRTPMNGVVGMADLLGETGLSEEQQLYLDTIRSSGEALLVIINDILDYSKIEAEKLQLNPEPFDLERAVHEVVMLLQPTARDKEIELLVDYDMFLPTRFVGDAGRVRQILTNLVGNAVKFTIEGSVLVRVVGMVDPDDRTAIHITIEDTGIGIPPDKVDHVFGEFNQVEDERNRKFEGTGLGLAITKRLVELMEGEIWVESELGRGSCFGFRIILPAAEPIVYETAEVPPHLKEVMVVDDHGANRMILSKQLQILGLNTRFRTTGADAIDDMRNPPDLIISEQDLPDMTGDALVAHLRQRQIAVPVILMAGNPAELPAGIADLVHAVLQKPAPRRALFQSLERLAPPSALPLPPPAPSPAPAGADPAPRVATPEGPALDVLLAEDNKTNQLVFRKMVSGLNLTLRIANNGIEAVAAFQDRRPDLIFMDISMPQMDGKQATREIRRLEGNGPHVPIIAVTAHAMEGDRQVILEAGLDDYLTKPLRKAELTEKLSYYLARAGTPASAAQAS